MVSLRPRPTSSAAACGSTQRTPRSAGTYEPLTTSTRPPPPPGLALALAARYAGSTLHAYAKPACRLSPVSSTRIGAVRVAASASARATDGASSGVAFSSSCPSESHCTPPLEKDEPCSDTSSA